MRRRRGIGRTSRPITIERTDTPNPRLIGAVGQSRCSIRARISRLRSPQKLRLTIKGSLSWLPNHPSRCACSRARFPQPISRATGSRLSSLSIQKLGAVRWVAPLFQSYVLAGNRRSAEPRGSSPENTRHGSGDATDGGWHPMATLCCLTMTAPHGGTFGPPRAPQRRPKALLARFAQSTSPHGKSRRGTCAYKSTYESRLDDNA